MRPATRPHDAGAHTRASVPARPAALRIGPVALSAVAGWLCVATMLALASPGVRIAPIDGPEGRRIERPVEAAAAPLVFPARPAEPGAAHPPAPRSAAPEPSGAAEPPPAAPSAAL